MITGFPGKARPSSSAVRSAPVAPRRELQLPPAVRVASITGGRSAVGHFGEAVEQQLGPQGIVLRTAGPAPLVIAGAAGQGGTPGAALEDVRTLLFIPYGQAAEVTRVLRAVKVAAAAKRTDDPVQLRLDGVDVL